MKRPTPAMAVSLAALVVALGGSASAAKLLSGRDIRDGTITARDLAPSLRAKLVAPRRALEGPRGPAGPAGPTGATGPAGGFDPAKVTYVTGPQVVFPYPAQFLTIEADCPAGAKAVAGGLMNDEPLLTVRSGPVANGSGWRMTLWVDGPPPGQRVIAATAVCVGP